MDFIQWISQVGTDGWVSGFVANNKYFIGAVVVILGGFLKGRWPELWANISTAIPFVGNPKKY